MNQPTHSVRAFRHAFRLWLNLRRLLPKQNCRSFGHRGTSEDGPRIERVYVINLDRESDRWSEMEQELGQVMTSSGVTLSELTERHVAVDANAFSDEPPKDADIDPFYTLGDQLFVEPQPLVFPTKPELDTPIRMSRAEVAVARSHIAVWRRLAASNDAYAMILEDDVWFHFMFARCLDRVWNEWPVEPDSHGRFDILYVSYLEVRHGAPKVLLSKDVFRPVRGLWCLSGYILSREGAQKLLRLLPCRGPIDLWLNHQFEALNVLAIKKPLVRQRRDVKSTNSYSILPALTAVGAITSEGASLFHISPNERPVFAFGPAGSGHSSLAMALCMLGYRCCSDLDALPTPELERLLAGASDRVFDAYVNIGSLDANIAKLRRCYPNAKFILTAAAGIGPADGTLSVEEDLDGTDMVVLHSEAHNKWQIVCEHLRCAPPTSSFPLLRDLGQRRIQEAAIEAPPEWERPKRDKSPWIVEPRPWWRGIRLVSTRDGMPETGRLVRSHEPFQCLDTRRWLLRGDTFAGNLALFRSSNVEITAARGAALIVRREPLGVRSYSAAAISSRARYLFGKFEATIQASGVPGVVTGFFLHRDSPRQEIDIEITGDRPDRLVVNVFYNPGGEGAKFDYGYRGAPSYIDLGFDASKGSHRFAIEWSPSEIIWRVDEQVVHRRAFWDPTPIPHLPMTLHVNCWPSRSTELAGRVKSRRLPTTATVRSVFVEAAAVSDPM